MPGLDSYTCPYCDQPHKTLREALFCCLSITAIEQAVQEELDELP